MSPTDLRTHRSRSFFFRAIHLNGVRLLKDVIQTFPLPHILRHSPTTFQTPLYHNFIDFFQFPPRIIFFLSTHPECLPVFSQTL